MTDSDQIRPQYHFRRVDGALHAWDIRRLVALTQDLVPEPVPLSQVAEVDEPYWSADGPPMTGRVVLEHAQLIRAADLRYPIILCPEGRIMDGMHRVLRALDDGRDTIPAYRLITMPAPDAIDVAPDDLPY